MKMAKLEFTQEGLLDYQTLCQAKKIIEEFGKDNKMNLTKTQKILLMQTLVQISHIREMGNLIKELKQ